METDKELLEKAAKAFGQNIVAQPEQEPVACANGCKGFFKYAPPQRTWVGLMRGVRVEGDTVVISVVGGNDGARELCGALINELEQAKQ